MKRLLAAIAPAALLAACSGGEPAEAPAADETVAALPTPAAVEQVTEGGYLVTAGTYEATAADGTAIKNVLNGDGTYTRSMGATTETGTWKNDQGKTCFDPEGTDAQTSCLLVASPAADGTVRTTGDDGVTLVWTKSA
ncbi:hypothetical protein [Tsuneonella sp. HG222]